MLKQDDAIILGYVSLAEAKEVYENNAVTEEKTEEKSEEKTKEEPKYTVTIQATQSSAAMGELVTLTAVLPEGLSADNLLFTWQMYSQTNGWIEIDGAYEQSYTFAVDTLHLLNDIRVQVTSMPAIAPMSMMRMTSRTLAAAVEEEEPEQIDISSSTFSLSARSTGEIFWNPYDEPIFNEDGLIIVGAGNDTNSGAEDAPVLTLQSAIQLAGAGGSIVCMNLLDVYDANPEDDALTTEQNFNASAPITVKGYAGNEYDGSAHDGMFFSVKSGQMQISNMTVTDSRSVLELDGGSVTLGAGISMPGYIFINRPTYSMQPITVTTANGANDGAFIVNFNSSYSGKVGIAVGEHATDGLIQLSDSLENKGWVLFNEGGNTYAQIPPEYKAIYIDGVFGNDTNYGNSPEEPIKTLAKAEELLDLYTNKIEAVYVMNTVSLEEGTATYDFKHGDISVHVRRYGNTWSGAMFKVTGGDHSMHFVIAGEGSTQPVIQAAGGTVRVDANTTFQDCAGLYLSLSGGTAIVDGVNYENVHFAGGNGVLKVTNSTINGGDTSPVNMTGGSFTSSGSTYKSNSATTISMSGGSASLTGDTLLVNPQTEDGKESAGSIVGASISLIGTEGSRMILNNITASGTLDMDYVDAQAVKNSGRSTLDFSTAASLETGSALIKESTISGNVDASTSVEAENSSITGSLTAGGNVTLKDSPVTGSVSAQGNATVQNTEKGKGDIGGSITVGGTGTLDKLSLVNISINGVATITDVEATGSVTVQNRATITDSSMNSLQTSGKATITDSTVTTTAKTAAADISGSTEIETLTATGAVTVSGGAKIASATTPAVTVNDKATNIETLTASGNVTLVGGSVGTLTASANVTASSADVAVTKLILKGGSSVFTTDGTATANDITLQGSNAYILLNGVPKSGKVEITISSERKDRIIVKSGSSVKAFDYAVTNQKPDGVFKRANTSADFWFDHNANNDIILGAATGVYVDTVNGRSLAEVAGDENETNRGLSHTSPVNNFADAVALLEKDTNLPRQIYIIGQATIAEGDKLAPSDSKVTVLPYELQNTTTTLIQVPAGRSFSPTNVDFDGAGVSTLFDVDGELTLSNAKLSNCGTAINNSGTVSGSATIDASGTAIVNSGSSLSITGDISAGGMGIDTECGTVTISGSITASGKGVEMADGTLTVTKGIKSGGTGLDMEKGVATISGGISASGKGAEVTQGTLTVTGNVTASGTGIDMGVAAGNKLTYNGGDIAVSGGSSANGIVMGDGEATITNADITVYKGTGLNIKGGTATVTGSEISVSSGTGVSMTAGSLDYNGDIYGTRGITVSGGTVDFRGGRCSSSSSSYSGGTVTVSGGEATTTVKLHSGIIGDVKQSGGTVYDYTGTNYNTDYSTNYVYRHTITGGLAYVEGNVKTLSQSGGTVNVKSGYVGSMSQSGGESKMTGGTVSSMSFSKGKCTVDGGTISYISSMSGGLTTTTLDVKSGTVSNMSQSGGTTTLTGGTIGTATINAADTAAKIYANGGSLSTCRLYADNAILHTNGLCNIGEVYLGEADSAQHKGANAYLALSGAVQQSGFIYVTAGDANYYEGYPVVRPDPSADNAASFDTTEYLNKFSIDKMKKRFNLTAGSGENARCIVLSFAGVFIDTQHGDDDLDGLSVETAVQTFERASQVMNEQPSDFIPVIYVVNMNDRAAPATAVVSGNDTLNTNRKSNGQVYVAPFAHTCNTLIEIPANQSLEVTNTDIDGEGNNAGAETATVVKVAGTLTTSSGSDIINGRSTVMDIASSGTVNLTGSRVAPSDDCYSSATTVDLNGGSLTLNSGSYVNYGKVGVDMNGGSLTIGSGASVSSSRGIGVKMLGGTVNVAGSISSSNGAGISVQGSSDGARVTVSGTVSGNGDGIEVLSGANDTDIDITGDVKNNSYNGIEIASGTTITDIDLNGANIDNNSYHGIVMASGDVTMAGSGTVNGNYRGGISVSGGSFTQESGSVSNNGVYLDKDSNVSGLRSYAASGISVSGGSYTLISGTVNQNGSTGNGGGINHTGGTLTITNATVSKNWARSNGGGLYAGDLANLSVSNITLSDNVSTGGNGGGLYYVCATGTVNDSDSGIASAIITGNKAENGNGGGIYIKGSSTEHSHSFDSNFTITGNKAKNGSGVYSACQKDISFSCTMNYNEKAGHSGGSIYVENANVTVDTNLGSNSAVQNGGAIYLGGGSLTLGENAVLDTGEVDSGNGGQIYIASGNLTVNSSAQLGKGTATNGFGGVIYMAGSGKLTAQNNTQGFVGSANNGGVIYYASNYPSSDSSSSDDSSDVSGTKLSGTASNDGGAIYMTGSGKLIAGKYDNTNTGEITGTATGGDGGAIYKAGSGTVTVKTGTTVKGTAASGNGGVVYVAGGTATMNGVVVGKAGTGDFNAQNGGIAYVASGTANLNNITRLTQQVGTENKPITIKASEDGGAVYIKSGKVGLDSADLSESAAKNGGAVYLESGELTLNGTKMDGATATDQGGAIYAAGGTVTYKSATTTDAKAGTNKEGSTNNDFGTVYVALKAKFDHVSGTIDGNVQCAGDYTVTLSDTSGVAITGGIELLTGTKPLTISENSSTGYTGEITVTVDTGFSDGIIVKGTSTVPARFESGTENITKSSSITWNERGNNIIGPIASDVFWDPNMASSNTKDENNGADANNAVLSFERAKDLLAKRGPTARIVLCSPSVYSTRYQESAASGDANIPEINDFSNPNINVYEFDGEIVCTEEALKGRSLTATEITELKSKDHYGKTWDATIIRNDGASGYMITFNDNSGLTTEEKATGVVKNMTISGEFLNGQGTATGALIGSNINVTVEDVTLINNAGIYGGAIALHGSRADYGYRVKDCTISNCSANTGGAIYTKGGALNLTGTSISGCTATSWGGAIYSDEAYVFITGGSISGCTAANGAAIYANQYPINITGGSFSNNHATGKAPNVSQSAPIYAGSYLEINSPEVHGEVYKTVFKNNSGDGAGAIVTNADAMINNTKFVGNNGGNTEGFVGAGALLSFGYTYINYSLFENNVSEYANGGAISANYGSNYKLALNDTHFVGNKTNKAGSGGAVYLGEAIEMFEISDCRFEGNSAAGSGGALYMYEAAYFNFPVYDCTFKDNSADSGNGGAIYIYNTENTAPQFNGCKFGGNHAGNGAAIYCNNSKELVMDESQLNTVNTFTGNYTTGTGADTAIVYLSGSANIKHIVVGNAEATAYPETKEAALASGGNASGNMIYSKSGYLRIVDIQAKGNYAPNSVISNGNTDAIAVLWDDMDDESTVYSEVSHNYTNADRAAIYYAGKELQLSGVKLNNNSATAVYCGASSNSANRALSISGSELNNNGKSGLIVEKNSGVSTLGESLSVESSKFNGNAEYGAKLAMGIASSAAISKFEEGDRSSFNNNGIEGLYLECSTPNSNYIISLDGVDAKNNGRSNTEGRGIYIKPYDTGTGYYAKFSIANATVSNNGSAMTEKGGGMYVASGATLTMDSTVTISNNEAEYSGAIYWEKTSDTEDGKGAKLIGNKAKYGGAVYVDQDVDMHGFVIRENEAELGGGIYFANSSAELIIQNSENHRMELVGNKAEQGGAIYIQRKETEAQAAEGFDKITGELIINSALISGNRSEDTNGYDSGFSSGIYNGGRNLFMAGSNVEISDNIYLLDKAYPIYLNGTMSRGSEYKVALNMNLPDASGNVSADSHGYTYDDTIVAPNPAGHPDNSAIYLRYITPIIEGNVFSKGLTEIDNTQYSITVNSVVLKRCYFVDSTMGTDSAVNGLTPGTGAFETIEYAMNLAGESGAVIYVSGPVYPTAETWNPNGGIEIRRYTGFAIGGDVTQTFDPYYGDMITVGSGNKTRSGIDSVNSLTVSGSLYSIAGWHTASDSITANGSIFRVKSGASLSFTDGIELIGNSTSGNGGAIYIESGATVNMVGEENIDIELSALSAANGGAIYVANGGKLNLNGYLNFVDNYATNGGAIYAEGTVNTTGTNSIGGNATNGGAIYVAKTAVFDAKGSLTVNGSASNGGGIYNEGTVNVYNQLTVSGTAGGKGSAIYHSGDSSELVFKQGSSISTNDVVYITDNAYVTMNSNAIGGYSSSAPLNMDIGDPRDGRVYVSYTNSGNVYATERDRYALAASITKSYGLDKNEDETAYGTLDLILSQTDIYYVGKDTNPNDNAGLTNNKGWSPDYPFDTIEQALQALGTKAGTIYIVDTVYVDSDLTLDVNNQITIRRYAAPVNRTGSNYGVRTFNRDSLTGALFTVPAGKTLTLQNITIDGHASAITNSGPHTKFTIANGVDMTAPLVDVKGTLVLGAGASLTNNNGANNAVDAADNGNVIRIEGASYIDGTVKLQKDTFISVNDPNTSPASDISILLADAYDGRVIARYGNAESAGKPADTELKKYLLEDSVLKDYSLVINGSDIVLRAKNRVYVHGGSGVDTNDGTPDSPIATLAEAYRRLQEHGGNSGVIYILGTVNVSGNITLSDNRYTQGEQNVVLPEDYQLTIKRYAQPTAQPEGFTAGSFTDALLHVANGGTLSLNGITVDGHGIAVSSGNETEIAGAINAKAPLITVSGTLNLDKDTVLQNNICAANTSGGAIRVLSSGTVNMRDASILNNSASYGQGIWLSAFGTLDLAGNPAFGIGNDNTQWIYPQSSGNGISAIQVSDELSTTTVPVQLPDKAVTYDTVIAEYADGLTADESVFKLTDDNYALMQKNIITKTVSGQQVILRQSYRVRYILDGKDGSTENPYDALKPMTDAPVLAARLTDLVTGITGDKDHMPLSISVKVTDTNSGVSSDAGFEYDRETGSIKVNAGSIKGTVEITANSLEDYSLTKTYTGFEFDDSIPTSVIESTGFSGNLKLQTGYIQPESITVKVGGEELVAGVDYIYEYDSCKVEVFSKAVTGDVEIIAVATKLHGVSYELSEGITPSGSGNPSTLVPEKEDLNAYFELNEAYNEPTVIVKLNGAELGEDQYSYDLTDGIITISLDKSKITGDVFVKLDTAIKTYFVTQNITGASSVKDSNSTDIPNSGETYKVNYGQQLDVNIAVPEGSDYPDKLSIKLDGKELAASDYDYNPTTGELSIKPGVIKGNVEIIGQAKVKTYAVVTKVNPDGTASFEAPETVEYHKDFTVTVNPSLGYRVDTITVEGLDEGEYSVSGNTVTVKPGFVDGVVTVTATTVQQHVIRFEYKPEAAFTNMVETMQVDNGKSITADLGLKYGYKNPTVKVSDRTGTVAWNEGKFVVDNINSNITVTVHAERESYGITGSLVNVSSDESLTQSVLYGDNISFTITAETGYDMPTAIEISEGTDYLYTVSGDKNSATLTIKNVSANVEFKVTGVAEKYAVTMNGGMLLTMSGDAQAEYASEYTGTVTAKSDVPGTASRPGIVSYVVKGGAAKNDGENDEPYTATVDPSTGEFTIPAEHVTGEIEITAIGVQSFAVKANIQNASVSAGGNTVSETAPWTVAGEDETHAANPFDGSISANSGYAKPNSVSVKIGNAAEIVVNDGVTYTDASDSNKTISYNKTSGQIIISADAITDDVLITGNAVKLHTVSYTVSGGNIRTPFEMSVSVEENATFNGASFETIDGYKIKTVTVTKTSNGDLNNCYVPVHVNNGDVLRGNVVIGANVINKNIEVSITLEKRQYEVTSNIEHTKLDPDDDKTPNIITVNHGETDTITITPDTGYNAPESVTITVTNPDTGEKSEPIVLKATDEQSTDGYRYVIDENGNGVITKDGGIVDIIEIDGEALPKTYSVTYDLTKNFFVLNSEKAESATYGTTLVAEGFKKVGGLKGTVSYSAVEVTVVNQTGPVPYTQDETTGKITIDAKYITGPVTIKATATQSFSVSTVVTDNVGASFSPASGTLPGNGLTAKTDFSTIITADTANHYVLPDSVTVTGASNWNYVKSTGSVSIVAADIHDDVTITVDPYKQYNVAYTWDGGVEENPVAPTCVKENETLTASFGLKTGYEVKSISVTKTNGDWIYSSSNAAQTSFTLTAEQLANADSDLNVTVVTGLKNYTVAGTMANVTAEYNEAVTSTTVDGVTTHTVQHGSPNGDVVITLDADTGYDLPDEADEIIVSIGGVSQTVTIIDSSNTEEHTGITYNKDTGVITIPAELVSGNIEFTATGTAKQYKVKFVYKLDGIAGSYGTPTEEVELEYPAGHTAIINANTGYRITGIKLEMKGAAAALYDEQNLEQYASVTGIISGTRTSNQDYTQLNLSMADTTILDDVTITATVAKRVYKLTESVDDATVKLGTTVVPENVPGTTITHGEGITLTIDPDDDHVLPDSVFVIVPGHDEPIEVPKGGEKDGISYTEEGIVTIPGNLVNGNISISGKALQKFDVDVEISPNVVNDIKDYEHTESTKDISYSGNGENVATESKPHELTITPEIGYSIISIKVDNGTETGKLIKLKDKEEGYTDPEGYSYDETGDKLTIAEVKGDVTVTVITERTRYDVEYVLKEEGKPAVLKVKEDYTEENGNLPIHGADFTTYIEGTNSSITLPDSITVTVGGVELPATDENGNPNYTYISSGAEAGKILIHGDKVNGNVVINAVGIETFDVTLSTLEAPAVLIASDKEPDTEEIDLIIDPVTAARLEGKTFKITKVTTTDTDANDGTFTLLPSSDFTEEVVKTSGSSFANCNFGLTASINNNTVDVKEGNELAFGDATELSLQIYNANAITAYGIAGTVVIELESYDAEGTLIGDKFTINVAIDRTPSQLNVTVPLVLVMKTNIDGGSVNMENSSYAIENESSMRVKLTDAKVDNMSGNTMTKVDSKAALTGVDQFYVGVTVPQTIEADGSVDANGNATDICKPITEIATSPLSFVTKEGAEYGLHMATVTYTVKIPE